MRFPSVFKVRTSESEETHQDDPTPTGPKASSRANDARKELLLLINDFIVRHDLAITSQNMATISGALSGSHPELSEAFVAREISGEPIDQRWLDTLARLDPDGHSRIAEIETLMDKLEYSLMRFSQTARSAETETSDHRGALSLHVEALTEHSATPATGSRDLAEVLDLSRTMLTRIEAVEDMMRRSQRETEHLRESLAKARVEADVDHLTRLPNRRAFERRLVSATLEAQAKGEPLSLAFCDVDHFKAINDKHGHDAGDRVLCALAATLNEHARDDCFVARHGGEEFVLLLYSLDKEAAWTRVDSIRRAQALRRLINRETGKGFGQITFSAGVAEITEYNDMRSALARADAALYRAKNGGRNRIELG
jgi:diguanylate cyclase